MTEAASMNWSREFDEPIVLPDGRELVTLEDAGNYITKLSKAEREAPDRAFFDTESVALLIT